jgi:hypothetical protein
VRPYLAPLVRSIAAPIGRMRPSQAHGVERPELYSEQEGMTDRGNPYAYGAGGVPPHGYDPLAGQDYGAIPQVHNHDAFGAPLEPRTAIGTAYVTPQSGWNLSGISSGWSVPGAGSVLRRPPTAKLAWGRMGMLHTGTAGAPKPPLPTLPEAQRMVQPQL